MAKESTMIKEVRYDGKFLYLRKDGKEECLGDIRTMKGTLTQEQKLTAVANKNSWVKIRGNTIDRKSLAE